MAPTETLATQHLIGLAGLCEPLGVRVVGLMQGTAARERRAAEGLLASGEPAVAVGTHALIQAGVDYGALRVAVVDEQHRFGVEQRRALEEKAREGPSPHVLHMTATPIPRTLALSVYGDLEVSVLDELPAGRAPVVTRVLGLDRRDEVFARMRRLLDDGRQAYVVCPLVAEADDARAAAAAESEAARLGSGELRGYRLECIHGQLPVPERRRIMDGFRTGAVQVLVATTVIEVGVDVPNATVMVIEQADLFGLAQLHQLRGRVGRGAHESFCMLLADPATDEARARLDAMARISDGFELADVDLELRGEGALLGLAPDRRPRPPPRPSGAPAPARRPGSRGRQGGARRRPRDDRPRRGDHRRGHPAGVRRGRRLARAAIDCTGADRGRRAQRHAARGARRPRRAADLRPGARSRSSPSSATSQGRRCWTRSPAPGRSASRPCRAAPRPPRSAMSTGPRWRRCVRMRAGSGTLTGARFAGRTPGAD